MTEVRRLLLACGLTEQIKWGKPCYAAGGRNVAILQEMKGFLALMFFKGALLDDPHALLKPQGPNSRSALRVEVTSVDEVRRLRKAIEALVRDAIAVGAAGLNVGPAPEPVLAEELQLRLGDDRELHAAFAALTPGRRREYNLYVSEAKRAQTRTERVERCVPRILAGKGLRDL